MKKLLALAVLAGMTSASFGQGIINFANQLGTRISTNGTVTVAAPVGTWYFALFRAASTQNTVDTSLNPLSAGWTLVAYGTNTASAGRLSGNTTTEGVVSTPNAPSTDDYAVAGWSANIGTDWASVVAFFGNSPTGAMNQNAHDNGSRAGQQGWFAIAPTIGNDIIAQPTAGSINNLFGTAPGLITGFGLNNIAAVPEPSTIALAGLGAAALVIFRRRKA